VVKLEERDGLAALAPRLPPKEHPSGGWTPQVRIALRRDGVDPAGFHVPPAQAIWPPAAPLIPMNRGFGPESTTRSTPVKGTAPDPALYQIAYA